MSLKAQFTSHQLSSGYSEQLDVRVSSPLETSSTLMTSAPRSANNIVAVGPARTRVKSKILIPWSGGGIPGPYGMASASVAFGPVPYQRVCLATASDS